MLVSFTTSYIKVMYKYTSLSILSVICSNRLSYSQHKQCQKNICTYMIQKCHYPTTKIYTICMFQLFLYTIFFVTAVNKFSYFLHVSHLFYQKDVFKKQSLTLFKNIVSDRFCNNNI